MLIRFRLCIGVASSVASGDDVDVVDLAPETCLNGTGTSPELVALMKSTRLLSLSSSCAVFLE